MGLRESLSRALPPVLRRIPRDRKWLYPFYLAGNIVLREEERPLEALPEAFDGFVVAYATDIHFGAYLDAQAARQLQARIVALGADLILLGGDYGEDYGQAVMFFETIPAFPAGTPVLAALGNHDYPESGLPLDSLLYAMREKNVQPLVNQTRVLRRGGGLRAGRLQVREAGLPGAETAGERRPVCPSLLPFPRPAAGRGGSWVPLSSCPVRAHAWRASRPVRQKPALFQRL